MGLEPGSHVGPYEIFAPLGAGGMGEVYRARDARLGREVALKVLPASVSSDPERLKRFEKEARSASSLNHPNIVTVYDAGESGGVAYLAMELVAGLTLRELLAEGPLPTRRVLAIAAQAADGLAKAHEAGIVHRDLKPENVMVTKDGFAKILDFGLAKLTQPEDTSAATHAPTLSAGTAPGMVMGTVGYMSPEQAQGRPLDFRSDQFSLGSILYEMTTGRRAFARGSAPETMAAIIREEPEAIGALVPAVPVPLRWIVERCLAKAPEERYASTRDLARDLARLRDGLSEASLTGPAPATASARRGWPIPLVLGLVAGAAVGAVAVRSIRPAPADWRLVTFGRGAVGRARFSPDGQTILYGAAWEGKPVQLYSTRLESAESTALPLPSASLVSVSSTGKLAIALARASPVLAEVPLAGGAPREILEDVEFADWAPGSESLAVIRDSRLEFPIGKVLYDAPGGQLSYPRFSPTGDAIALVESHNTTGSSAASIVVVSLDGAHKTVSSGWEVAVSLAWNPRTDEVWFSAREKAGPFGGLALHAASRSGRHRVVARGPDLLFANDISKDGRVLLAQAEWRTSMMCRPAGTTREVDLSWLDYSTGKDLSEDGRSILFDEGGIASGAKGAVYLRATDGSAPAVRLGEGTAVALSPDGKWAISIPTEAPDRLVLLPTGAGEAKVFREPGMLYRNAQWFPDGKRMIVGTGAPGHPRLYVQDLAGGPPRGLTPEGFINGPVSPDGKRVAARSRGDGKVILYPIDGGEPRTVPGIDPSEAVIRWDGGGAALLLASADLPGRIERFDLATGKRQLLQELAPADPTGVVGVDGVGGLRSVSVTSDGRSYTYSFQRTLGRLFVVTGLE